MSNTTRLPAFAGRPSQRGVTLFIAMVFVLIFGSIAAAAVNNSMTSVQAINNMQWRSEALAASSDVIERLLSSTDFATSAAAMTTRVNATPYGVDITGDGYNDVSVSFPSVSIDGVTKAGPRCIRYRGIPLATLDPTVAEDKGCFGSSNALGAGMATETTVAGVTTYTTANSADSMCANTDWVIPVRASDAVTNTSVDVYQGASVRVFQTDAANYCN